MTIENDLPSDSREVTKTEFWKHVGHRNVHPRIVGKYPYTSIFESLDGGHREYGRIVSELVDGAHPPQRTYFVRLT